MSAEQGEADQKPSMEHGYLGPIFDNAEALSLAEAYDYMRGLVEVQSTNTEVFKKAFNHVRNFGQVDIEVVSKVRQELEQSNVTLKSFEIAQLINLTPSNDMEGVESAKEMIPSLARFTEHQLLGFLDVLQQLQSPSYMSN